MKDLIYKQVQSMKDLKCEVNKINTLMGSPHKNGILIAKRFQRLLKKYKANPLLLKSLSDFLQLNNDEDLNYDLSDVLLLLQELVNFNKDDLEANLELFYFTYNVLDDEANAKTQLNDFKSFVKSHLDEADKHCNYYNSLSSLDPN